MTDTAVPSGLASAPAATRPRRPGWRDPRILVGLVIVAGSVLLGVKVLAAADDTVPVWAVTRDLPAGTELRAADLESRQLRFTSSTDADRYVSAEDPFPRDRVLSRPVGRGELLPRAALGDAGDALVEVPLSVDVDAVPDTVEEGSIVDVWVTPEAVGSDELTNATRVLDDVVVVRAATPEQSLAPNGTRQVIVGVPPADADQLAPALGRTASGRVVITRQA